jgi:Ran GTPase-activating protein (RanGAP) involved in mRNA processing and transport
LGNQGVSLLAGSLFARNGILRKLDLSSNEFDSEGLRSLVDGMIQHESQLTDLDLFDNLICEEGASYLADNLGNNALPHLTRLSLSYCGLQDDGLAFLVSALQTNQSLAELDLTSNTFSERGFSSLAMSLPKIKN